MHQKLRTKYPILYRRMKKTQMTDIDMEERDIAFDIASVLSERGIPSFDHYLFLGIVKEAKTRLYSMQHYGDKKNNDIALEVSIQKRNSQDMLRLILVDHPLSQEEISYLGEHFLETPFDEYRSAIITKKGHLSIQIQPEALKNGLTPYVVFMEQPLKKENTLTGSSIDLLV